MSNGQPVKPLPPAVGGALLTVFIVKAIRYIVHGDTEISESFINKTVNAWNLIILLIISIVVLAGIVGFYEVNAVATPVSIEVTFHE